MKSFKWFHPRSNASCVSTIVMFSAYWTHNPLFLCLELDYPLKLHIKWDHINISRQSNVFLLCMLRAVVFLLNTMATEPKQLWQIRTGDDKIGFFNKHGKGDLTLVAGLTWISRLWVLLWWSLSSIWYEIGGVEKRRRRVWGTCRDSVEQILNRWRNQNE